MNLIKSLGWVIVMYFFADVLEVSAGLEVTGHPKEIMLLPVLLFVVIWWKYRRIEKINDTLKVLL